MGYGPALLSNGQPLNRSVYYTGALAAMTMRRGSGLYEQSCRKAGQCQAELAGEPLRFSQDMHTMHAWFTAARRWAPLHPQGGVEGQKPS